MSRNPALAGHLECAQFVNTLARVDGGPARNSLEVNLALNALPDVSVRMFWVSGARKDSVLRDDKRAAPLVGPLHGNRAQAVRAVRSADVVILHGFYLWWVPFVALLCGVFRTPYVIMPHGVFTSFQRSQSVGRKRIFDFLGGQRILRRAACVVVASETERQELLQFDPRVRTAITGVGTAVVVQPASGSIHSPLRLVSMSRIAPKKRVDVAIETLAALREHGVEASLTVAGTGDTGLLAQLQDLAIEAGVDEAVDFVGEVAGDRKRHLLTSSDVFLAPSEDENFGIAVAEAMAHGLPVVATARVSSAAIADGVAGAIIPSPSPALAADAVLGLLQRADFPALRLRATELATEHYAWKTVALRWAAELRRVSAQ